MKRYPGVPEMLEQIMQESGTNERWVTVREIRERFQLTRYQCTTVFSFLRRLEYCPFRQYPFIVRRVERPQAPAGRASRACRYLVSRVKGTLPVDGNTPVCHSREKPLDFRSILR